ncbi:diguanylate cyclase [Aquabacterium sp.]|uniref:GGDEF domain-containing protein n=1 Tax=Aquabacterium sp. TaxID=1872578 RepID=UPI003784E093
MKGAALRVALLLVLAATAGAAPPTEPAPAGGPDAVYDVLVREGEDHLDQVMKQLDALPPGPSAADQRLWAMARAEIGARGGDAAWSAGTLTQAVRASRAVDAGLAEADEAYLTALRGEREDGAGIPATAQRALAGYEAWCKAQPLPAGAASDAAAVAASGASGAAGLPAAPGPCEYRRRWRLLQLLANQARRQHATAAARSQCQAALALSTAAGDSWRQAWTETELALVANAERDEVRAQRHLARAHLLAERHEDVWLDARLLFTEATLASDRGDPDAAQVALQRALALARQAHAPRLEAQALLNLSDRAVRVGHAAEALRMAQQGLAIAQPLKLTRLERILQSNAVLARVALGRQAEARQDFEALQTAWGAEGITGMQVTTLREYGDALAAAGELKAALEIHHRERKLSQELMLANRDAALAELRTRYDREAQQRHIVQLERDNALKSAELANQGLQRKLWALGAGVLLLATSLMLLLLRRVRQTNRRLERSRARLRVQSERDALTGLANRRHFQSVLQGAVAAPDEGALAGGFVGALLMIDIDHFKHINDDHGHAAGDAVLVEVARRIAGAVRGRDTVARWGGEEFLVFAPGLQRDDAEVLAQRLLQVVAGTPVALPGGTPLRVAVSIGHAVFPLPPHRVALSPEQALNLVDMALYTAKSQGRNRAVGIVRADAADAAGLRALESDFERAWREGRVVLRIDPGP